MRMSLFCVLSRVDPIQEVVDETIESVNPLDQSVSGRLIQREMNMIQLKHW